MDSPGYVQAHEFIDGITTDILNLLKEVPLPISRAYEDGQVPINKKKIQDVVQIIKYIPDQYKEFYNTIASWKTTEVQEEEEENLEE